MKRENFERAKALIGRAKDVEDLIKSIRENGVLFFVPARFYMTPPCVSSTASTTSCSAVNPDCHV